jgi:hypothetical protein
LGLGSMEKKAGTSLGNCCNQAISLIDLEE